MCHNGEQLDVLAVRNVAPYGPPIPAMRQPPRITDDAVDDVNPALRQCSGGIVPALDPERQQAFFAFGAERTLFGSPRLSGDGDALCGIEPRTRSREMLPGANVCRDQITADLIGRLFIADRAHHAILAHIASPKPARPTPASSIVKSSQPKSIWGRFR